MPLNTASAAEITERREYRQRIVAATEFLGKQSIPFRGRDEQETSHHSGNFLECNSSKSLTSIYVDLYHSTQNVMFSSIPQGITGNIKKTAIKSSKMHPVMADEATYHRTRQLAGCVRYVIQDDLPEEAFLGLQKRDSFHIKSDVDGTEVVLQSHNLGDLFCMASEE